MARSITASFAAPMPPRPDAADRTPASGDEPPAQRLLRPADGPGPPARTVATATAPHPLPPRAEGLALPMTAARAELWRQARAAVLLDNTAELRRMGRGPVAQPLRRASPPGRPEAERPGALWLPMALPVPAAPQTALPPGDPVAAQRSQVLGWLGRLRAVAAEVHAEGASPDDEPDAFRKLDKLAMPAIVAALNAEDPGLRLVYAHIDLPGDQDGPHGNEGFGSREWTRFLAAAGPGRWRVVLDNMTHNLALDVHLEGSPGQAGRRGSVVHLSPSMPHGADPLITAAEMASQLCLPPDWPLLIADMPAQQSLRSCRIFALSMAAKCHRDVSLDALHAVRMAGGPLPFGTLPVEAELLWPAEDPGDSDGGEGSGSESGDAVRTDGQGAPPAAQGLLALYVSTAADAFGPAYMKHAQSRGAVLAYLARRPEQGSVPVNHKGQTLLERHDAHRVARWPQQSGGRQSGPMLQSASIELKRIAFLDKAIRHAARCDPGDISALHAHMGAVDSRWRDWYLR